MASVTHIWRHPVKALGCEAVERATLTTGRTMPFDRVWAILQQGGAFDPAAPAWTSKKAFNQGAKTQAFMAIRCAFDEAANRITLTHPERPDITLDPDAEAQALLDWITPLVPAELPQPAGIAKLEGNSLTDQEAPYISIIANASLAALSDMAGKPLEQERFRANIWLDGLAPWEEFDWIGKDIRIGTATLRVEARIGRCIATTANPATGIPDVDTLALLRKNCGHRDLGVFARVIDGGTVALNDTMEVL